MFQVKPGDEDRSYMHQRCIHAQPRYEGCWSCSHPVQTARLNRRPAPRKARVAPVVPTCSRCFSQHAGEC